MPAYVIVSVEIHDPVAYEEYKQMTPGSLAPFGGRFIVRGGETEVLEGSWRPPRLVVLEFPDAERARAWWASPEYAEAKALRQRIASTEMLLAVGVSGTPPAPPAA
jgi:uncharacterized protein (DUF1330 family)